MNGATFLVDPILGHRLADMPLYLLQKMAVVNLSSISPNQLEETIKPDCNLHWSSQGVMCSSESWRKEAKGHLAKLTHLNRSQMMAIATALTRSISLWQVCDSGWHLTGIIC